MSSKISDILKSIKQLVSFEETCVLKDESIEELQKIILEILDILKIFIADDVNTREYLPDSFYPFLIKYISILAKQWKNPCSNSTIPAVLKLFLKCFRNSLYLSEIRQTQACEDDCRLKLLFETYREIIFVYEFNEEKGITEEQEDLMEMFTTIFINLMAGGNSYTRNKLWHFFSPHLRLSLSFIGYNLSHTYSAVIHQFLLDSNIKEDIFAKHPDLINHLLNVYTKEGKNSLFTLLCIKVWLNETQIATSVLSSLSTDYYLLLLDISSSCVEEKSLSDKALFFIISLYKNHSDEILQNKKLSIDTQVFCRLICLLCSISSSENYQKSIQSEKSVLISTVYLVKSLKISSDGAKSATGESNYDNQINVNRMVCGLKSDLIRLIACLVSKNSVNQDLMRDTNGIILLLESSRIDDENPLIRENCIFALRNVMQNNVENQRVVAELEAKEVVGSKELEKMGMKASLVGGKVVVNSL